MPSLITFSWVHWAKCQIPTHLQAIDFLPEAMQCAVVVPLLLALFLLVVTERSQV